MTLKFRFLLLLGIMIAVLAVGTTIFEQTHRSEMAGTLKSLRDERAGLLGELIELTGFPLQQFARDYSLWNEMVAFSQKPDPEWARINIDASLDNFKVDSVSVYDVDGRKIYSVKSEKLAAPTEFSLGLDTLRKISAQSTSYRFFAYENDRLFEVVVSPLQPSEDTARTTPPRGWLVVAKLWDKAFLWELSKLVGDRVSVTPTHLDHAPESAANRDESGLHFPLNDITGRDLAEIRVSFNPELIENVDAYNFEELLVFVLQSIALIAITMLCLHLWVLRPFRILDQSLVNSSPDKLQPLLNSNSEIGHLARLIRVHFANQKVLKETIEERARLGRDLHDGVIQSIYAAGMGLSVARNMLRTDPPGAEKKLDAIRSALNDSIREARRFIADLDEVEPAEESFAKAVQSLADFMKSLRQARFDITIDDLAAAQLSTVTKAQTLQIIREAISNSLRHGEANNVLIRLERTTGGILLKIEDDGRGFDQSDRSSSGLGLGNFGQRAVNLGATFKIKSSPGKGTQISILFTPSSTQA